MPLPRTRLEQRPVQLPLNRLTSATLSPLQLEKPAPRRPPPPPSAGPHLPVSLGLTAQLQLDRKPSQASTPTTVRLDSQATTDSANELSPHSDLTPRPTSTDMSRRQIQMQRQQQQQVQRGSVDEMGPAVGWPRNYRHTYYEKNQQIPYDEQSSPDRSPRSERQQQFSQAQSLKRPSRDQTSLNGMPAPSSQFSPSDLSEAAEQQRRSSRGSQSRRHSFSQYDMTGAMALYNPVEHQLAMPPPPPHPALLSHAPSMGQLWFHPPPPPFAPYYYAPALGPAPFTDAKTLKKALKREEKHQLAMQGFATRDSFCCDGVAQLLWAIIFITLTGFLIALLLAFYVL